MKTRLDRKLAFIRQLAKFLIEHEAHKSMMLELGADPVSQALGKPSMAEEWARLRSTTPLQGYLSVDEAEQQLKEFLL